MSRQINWKILRVFWCQECGKAVKSVEDEVTDRERITSYTPRIAGALEIFTVEGKK